MFNRFPFSALRAAVKLIWPDPRPWLLGTFLVCLCEAIPNWVFSNPPTPHAPGHPAVYVEPSLAHLAPNVLLGLFLSLPTGILVVGLQQIALRRLHGERLSWYQLFQFERMHIRVGVWIVLFQIFQDAVITPTFWISRHYLLPSGSLSTWQFYLPWDVTAVIIFAGLTTPFLLVPLLIVEQKLSIPKAVAASVSAARPWLIPLFVASVGAQIFASIGVIACGLGLLLTYPVIFSFPATVYAFLVENNQTFQALAIQTEQTSGA